MSASTDQYAPFPDQTKTVEDPTKARIYLMRKEKFVGAGVGVEFYGSEPEATGPQMENSEEYHLIGKVGPHSYICWEETLHPFVLEMRNGNIRNIQVIDLKAGRVYYLQAYLHSGWAGVAPRFRILSEKEGQEMLKNCQPPEGHRTK